MVEGGKRTYTTAICILDSSSAYSKDGISQIVVMLRRQWGMGTEFGVSKQLATIFRN
jgi:hypothetical protein